MMILKQLATSSLAILMLSSTAAMHAQYGPPPGPPPPGYGQGGWDAPPRDIQSDAMRRGYMDGVEGARKDFENHRPPNVNNRDEYRHPKVGGALRHDYRAGFRRGYQAGVSHLMGGPGPR